MLTTTYAGGVLAPVDGRKTPPAQGAKVRTSISASWSGIQDYAATTCNYVNTATTDQIRNSMGVIGMPNAAINATGAPFLETVL